MSIFVTYSNSLLWYHLGSIPPRTNPRSVVCMQIDWNEGGTRSYWCDEFYIHQRLPIAFYINHRSSRFGTCKGSRLYRMNKEARLILYRRLPSGINQDRDGFNSLFRLSFDHGLSVDAIGSYFWRVNGGTGDHHKSM